MRETLKSLSIFSAMLLLLLLISSGCDVNIPGCGKRSLPFFKKITPPPMSVPVASAAPATPSAALPVVVPAAGQPATAKPIVMPKAPASATKEPTVNSSVEMDISKPKAVAAAPTATPTATATPLEAEKIAYTTIEKEKPTLWIMDPDGSNRTRLTAVGTSSFYPLWSPNGKILAFLSDLNGGKVNLFMMKKGSKEFEQVTDFADLTITNPSGLKPPFSWSPRSDEIAFTYHNQVWKVELAAPHQSTTLVTMDPAYTISNIEWAPHRDNKYVSFLVKKGQNYFALKLVNPRLNDQLALADSEFPIADLDWSADAGKVAYVTNSDSVFTASSETSIPKGVIVKINPKLGPLVSYNPADESPNPALMVLAKKDQADDDYCVAIVDKASTKDGDTGSLKFLTPPGVLDAIWSPDGKKIAYVLANGEFWTMDSSTGANKNRVALTGIQYPSWSKK